MLDIKTNHLANAPSPWKEAAKHSHQESYIKNPRNKDDIAFWGHTVKIMTHLINPFTKGQL